MWHKRDEQVAKRWTACYTTWEQHQVTLEIKKKMQVKAEALTG